MTKVKELVNNKQVELDRLTDVCESYLDDINILSQAVDYLLQQRSEGKLSQVHGGQFRLEGEDILLKEGYPLEVLIEDNGVTGWQIGRLMFDHTKDEYYFIGHGSKRYMLKPGMLAAVRLQSIYGQSSCQSHHS
ncbi:DUF5348 domain-containing protein [Desulforamulus reducens]|nr:DUF5348 domain-containing protein [Desulforamulus reducens]